MGETPRDTGHPRHDHERRDVNIRWIAYFGVGLVALHLVSAALMWGLFGLFEGERQRVDTLAPLADTQPLPPGPHLQASPAQELQEMLAAEDRLLHEYAWVDPSTGTVRIPIAHAMEIIAQHGLPDWRETPGVQGGRGADTGEERGSERPEQGTPREAGGS